VNFTNLSIYFLEINNSFREELSSILENKVDVEEVQRAITGCQNDAINRINASKQEVVQIINDFTEAITPDLNKKISEEELEARIADFISKNELDSELDHVNNNLIKDIRNLYSLSEKKTDKEEFMKERDNVGEILQNLENDLGTKINDADARDIINQKCNIDDVNKALTEVHDELDLKANTEDFEGHTKMQTEINQAL